MSERRPGLRRRSVVLLAVIAAVALTASMVLARTHVIRPDATPAPASGRPPLVLQGELTRRVPWADVGTTGSYDGREDPDNRHEELRALYRGEPLYQLVGLVDDDDPGTFNVAEAKRGYGIELVATDGYTWMVDSRTIVGRDDWVIARLKDGDPLPGWEGPYRFVGPDFIGFRAGQSVRTLERVRLLPGRVEDQTPQ